MLAHPLHEEQTWNMVTHQLQHYLAAYKIVPLNGFEKAAIINAVRIPCWCYKDLFRGNMQHMAQWPILLQYLQDTPGIEVQMNKHRITTDIRDGGMGLR